MLILARSPGESILIGDNVRITIVELNGRQVRIGLEAPRDVNILRSEIADAIAAENRSAQALPGESSESTMAMIAEFGLAIPDGATPIAPPAERGPDA